MPFEGEFASYEPLRRIMESESVKAIEDRFKLRNTEQDVETVTSEVISLSDLVQSTWKPDMVIGIDGSKHSVKAENGFPGAEFGYITIASVLILLKKLRELGKQRYISPKDFRETEKASTFDAIFPGCNVIIDNEADAKSSMRKTLFEQMLNQITFSEGETLLETYEALLKIKLDKSLSKPPKCPCDKEEKLKYGYGQYTCTHSNCGKNLYSTDAMRLHELHNPSGSCGEMYGQIMFTIERLWLIHILRAFERKNWLPALRRMAFVLDGPLAVYSTSSWLTKSISDELRRLNNLQKEENKTDLLILGIEKTGTFVNHFEDIDTSKSGVKGKIDNQSALLLSDDYIKKNIIFSQSDKMYGKDTYFGRKFFYKTFTGHRIVASIATFSDAQQSLKTANINQFPRLADAMNLFDQMSSNRYPNSVTPLITAHTEASIPLNLGKKLFEEIAREIRKRPTT